MSSNYSNRTMLDMSADDHELLMEEARRYLMHRVESVAEEGRSVDNIDIHVWVFRFVLRMVRLGRLNDELLAANIVQLTYTLWLEALLIAEEYEQEVIDARVP